MVIYVIYCHQLPFYLICEGAPHQIQPHFASFQQKCLEKDFFVALRVQLHPLHSLATPVMICTSLDGRKHPAQST